MRSENLLFIALIAISCQSAKPDPGKEKKIIEALLQQERKAHFERNADLFVSEFADSMISVTHGVVTLSAKEENRQHIQSYFNRSEFIKWDDTQKPVIRFSDDGSMAYAVVQKQVIILQKDTTGKNIRDTTDYAWVSIYRKDGGNWKVECNVSTDKE